MASNQQEFAERIAAARREADQLKEKIRTQREQSADSSLRAMAAVSIIATTASPL
ncbi:hypothetical protein FRB93_009829 [Tulasnella sp. JGI-2019a]|nr:hypothetical protein FRB93_009829 [Tulasnella sp. JGI-2019a]